MVVVLDTNSMPLQDRSEAVRAVIEATAFPMTVAYDGAADPRGSRWDFWQIGRAHVMRTEAVGLRLSRTRRQIRRGDPGIVTVSYNTEGRTVSWEGETQTVWGSELTLTDLGQPCDLTWDLPYTCIAFHVARDELCVKANTVDRASARLQGSPLHALVQGHLRRVADLTRAPLSAEATAMIGTSTLELVRAL